MTKLALSTTLGLSLAASGAFAQVNLTAMTSTPGVAVHLTIAHLAEVASARGIANIQITLGQTGANATLAVAEGRSDIGICPFSLPFLMARGVGPFADLGAERGAELAANLRVLYPYSFGAYTLYGYETAGVRGWDDLQGRRVLDGPPRGAATNEARSLIQAMTGLEAGSGFAAVESDWSQMATTITEGSVDVALLPEYIPSERPLQALSAGRMNFFSIPIAQFESEAVQRVLTAPGSAPFVLSAEQMASLGQNAHVVSEDGAFRTRGSVGGNCVHAAMDEELAYQLTRAHIETLDQIYEKALYARNVGLEDLDPLTSGMCGLNPVRYHPGAVRAWLEAGFDVPECAR